MILQFIGLARIDRDEGKDAEDESAWRPEVSGDRDADRLVTENAHGRLGQLHLQGIDLDMRQERLYGFVRCDNAVAIAL